MGRVRRHLLASRGADDPVIPNQEVMGLGRGWEGYGDVIPLVRIFVTYRLTGAADVWIISTCRGDEARQRGRETMTTFQITNRESGMILGHLEAETEAQALNMLARDAGYRDQTHAAAEGFDGSALLVQVADPVFDGEMEAYRIGYAATADEAHTLIRDYGIECSGARMGIAAEWTDDGNGHAVSLHSDVRGWVPVRA